MATLLYKRGRPGANGRQVQSSILNNEISDEKFIEHLKEFKFDSQSKNVILGLLPKTSIEGSLSSGKKNFNNFESIKY